MKRDEDIKEAIGSAEEREEISKIVKAAIKEYKKQESIEKKKTIFVNTKILLENYNKLKMHISNSITKLEEAKRIEEEKFGSEYEEEEKLNVQYYIDIGEGQEDLYIQSIMRSRIRTVIMVAHIEAALMELKEIQKKKGDIIKYEAVRLRYIEKHTMEDIAEMLKCDKTTVNRWCNAMITDLGVLIFGVDGMRGKIIL